MVYGVHLTSDKSYITLIGQMKSSDFYYPIVIQNISYILWGYENTPCNMTYNGTGLFINIVNFIISTESFSYPTNIPGFRLIYVLFIVFTIIPIIILFKNKILK